MMLEIYGTIGIVGVVLIFVIYRHEKSITATPVVFDALEESHERAKCKCTQEFWEMFMQALEDYGGLRDINVTVVVLYRKTGRKVSLYFAALENNWEERISERMLSLFARDWSKAWVEISGYSPDNMPDVAIDGASSDVFDNVTDGASSNAFDSVPDGILDDTIGGVLDSTTDGVSKVIPKKQTFLECWGNLICDNETGPVVGFDGFI